MKRAAALVFAGVKWLARYYLVFGAGFIVGCVFEAAFLINALRILGVLK